MTWRDAARASVVTTTAALIILLGTPTASALTRDDADDPGTPMSTLGWIFLFIVVPAALYALITLLVYLPSMTRKPRYRPESTTTWAAPVWFEGPDRAEGLGSATGSSQEPGRGGGGSSRMGASAPAVGAVALDAADQGASGTAAGGSAAAGRPAGGSLAGGGASARW